MKVRYTLSLKVQMFLDQAVCPACGLWRATSLKMKEERLTSEVIVLMSSVLLLT